MSNTSPIPHLVVNGGEAAIQFYTRAFGATLENKVSADDGKRLMHAHLKLGGGDLFLMDDFPEYDNYASARSPARIGGTSCVIHLDVPDADTAWERAVKAGAEVVLPLDNQFWGMRYGQVKDPFGHVWSIRGAGQVIIPGPIKRRSNREAPVISAERMVRANGVDLCVQTFGDPGEPPILLIHGAAASMLAWDDEFCRRLAAGPRFVIRYDHRDTGRSASYPPGAPPYTLDDLAADAAALLDVFGLERAHVVGRSMGGAIAMRMAIDRPERMASLALMVTSPGGPGLSPPSEAFLAHIQSARPPDWSDREAVVDHLVALLRVFDGGASQVERWITRDMVAREVDRTVNIASALTNHFLIGLGEPIRPGLGEITAPTLVVQGERDPVFAPDHGQTLAAEIPGARLLVLPGCGHLVLPPAWDQLIPAMLEHTGTASEGRARRGRRR